jgi:DNA-directed RNA polymerase specialized sigma24 family protein
MTDFEVRPADTLDDEIVEVTGLLRRIVARKVGELDAVEDIVQETVARLLAARQRLDGRAVGPYAIVTARNLVASRYERTVSCSSPPSTQLRPNPGAPDPRGSSLARPPTERDYAQPNCVASARCPVDHNANDPIVSWRLVPRRDC